MTSLTKMSATAVLAALVALGTFPALAERAALELADHTEQLDLQTRDDLRTALLGTANQILSVADRMTTTRNELARCLSNIVGPDGAITDAQAEMSCFVGEFVESRQHLASVATVVVSAEEDVRLAVDDYTAHANNVSGMMDGYKSEEVEIDGEMASLHAAGLKIKTFMSSGQALSPDRKKEAMKVAYRAKRLESRKAAIVRIVESLAVERGLFLSVKGNLESAADGLSGQSMSLFTQAEVLSDKIEEASVNQRLRTADFLAAAARADWSGLQDSLNGLNSVLTELGQARARFEFEVPDTKGHEERWAAAEDDSVLAAFLTSLDASAQEMN